MSTSNPNPNPNPRNREQVYGNNATEPDLTLTLTLNKTSTPYQVNNVDASGTSPLMHCALNGQVSDRVRVKARG